ncbi:dihydrolipoamide acetyltransferase component of pyruvate dehydrogenase complex [Agromyces rhizosphaerae]|uniref:Dihydrolipoamide acetyltransferase component of pyruvate dehydrogenase complex n=1 Tax=Agromyces rhizosphaerae TaxID=88374 RepID=A0A9W6CNI2_9MICO|nr:dihydrolipoamide acetyltransferase family protein [Agromyces rhizosphaerae]GLI25841.1 dihydrolipoamide acetyltransferase component of pyruvate dehydrogenase complex [Agromyces rhizosphaerae]
MSAERDFALPDLGEGLTESELIDWRVAVGDTVELNQIVADVETAKAVVELPSPVAGVVTALHAEPGQTVEVGASLMTFRVGGSDAPEPAASDDEQAAEAASAAEPEAPAPEAPAKREPNLVGYGAAADASHPKRKARRVPSVPAASAAEPTAAAASTTTLERPRPAERPRSTPPVRKLAHDLGVDLEALDGSGERGLITRADVEQAASARPAPAAPSGASAPADDRVTRTPVRGVRKHTAEAMVRSAFTAPHATEFLTVDVTASTELLDELRDDRATAGHRVTMLAMAAKATCIALARTPELNSRWDDEAHEIVQHHYVNLGIAVATERGLLVPNVRDAEGMSLLELADAIGDLAATARDGRTPPADLTGGTMSITNIGVFGIDAGTPILNPGEAAILATGAVRRMPWEHRGEVALRDVMTLSLSFDHRLVDGAQASRFLADVGAILRQPGRALTM